MTNPATPKFDYAIRIAIRLFLWYWLFYFFIAVLDYETSGLFKESFHWPRFIPPAWVFEIAGLILLFAAALLMIAYITRKTE